MSRAAPDPAPLLQNVAGTRRPTRIATTHKNADFDGVASVIAATILFPGTVPLLPKSVNANVKGFLSIHKDIFDPRYVGEVELDALEQLIVVDVNRWHRLDRLQDLQHRRDLAVLLWDHHGDIGDIPGDPACLDTTGANITLMIRELKNQRKLLTPIQATLFLGGIYEDTGHLSFPSTTAEDAHAAAWLLERKADLSVLGSFLRPSYDQKQKDILFQMLQQAPRDKVNGYWVSIRQLEIDGHVNGLAQVVNMYREIVNVDAAFGIFTDPDRQRCMVIGRSANEEIDVGTLMRSLGGGGHPGAGSALLKGANPDEIAANLVHLMEGNQHSSVQISDLMSFPVFSITPDTPMETVARLLRERGCTGLPVVENDALVGVISRRDFRKVRREDQLKAPVKAFMSRRIISIAPGMSPVQAARLMVKHDVGRLPVVDEGRLIGIVTRSDTMLYFYDLLPD